MCLAFGVERLDDVARKLSDVLEMQPPAGLVEKVRGLQKLKSIADSLPRTVRKGACQEIVLQGDDVDLGRLPVQRCWPGDPGAVHHAPGGDHARPARRHAERRHVPDAGDRPATRRSCTGRSTRTAAPTGSRATGRIPVAVALGLDPVTAYSASAPLPKHIDELMLAGFLRGEPVELVKGVTVDLEVPASAEIVLEGYVEKDEVGDEGPFGDHTGYYTAVEPFPVFHVTAMTMRRDAIYPSIVVGKPPQEDAWLGKATERIFLPAVRATVPEIVDYDLPVAGAFHNCCIVSIRKSYPGPGAEGDARALGARDAEPDEVHRRRRRARRRPRLRASAVLHRCERRSRHATSSSARGRPTTSTTRPSASSSAASSASTPRRSCRRRARGPGRRRSR